MKIKLITIFLFTLLATLGTSSACENISGKNNLKICLKDIDRSIAIGKFKLDMQIFKMRERAFEYKLFDIYSRKIASKSKMKVDEFIQTKIYKSKNLSYNEKILAKRNWIENIKKENNIQFTIPMPKEPVYKIAFDKRDPSQIGNSTKKAQVVVFSDFTCPRCAMFSKTFKQVKSRYGDKVDLIFKHYPNNRNPMSVLASRASMCASEFSDDDFWKVHDLIFDYQRNLSTEFITSTLPQLAKLDKKKYLNCIESNKYREFVQQEVIRNKHLPIDYTPSVFINGKIAEGVTGAENLSKVIDANL